jgi:hypothetical protein
MVRVMPPEHMAEYVQLIAEYPAAVARRDEAYSALNAHENRENQRLYSIAVEAVERIDARLKEIYPE